jgi:hypothetical protein
VASKISGKCAHNLIGQSLMCRVTSILLIPHSLFIFQQLVSELFYLRVYWASWMFIFMSCITLGIFSAIILQIISVLLLWPPHKLCWSAFWYLLYVPLGAIHVFQYFSCSLIDHFSCSFFMFADSFFFLLNFSVTFSLPLLYFLLQSFFLVPFYVFFIPLFILPCSLFS